MKHDDFVDVMREVVPQLIEDAVAREEQVVSGDTSAEEPEPKAAKPETPAQLVEHAIAYVAAAECSKQESRDRWNALRDTQENAVEVLIQQY